MGLVIGFGAVEQDFEAAEEQAIRDYVVARHAEQDASYFSDKLVEGVRQWVKERGEELRAEDRRYKTAENYPDRYSYFHSTVIADASHVVVILSWLHTNRRHGLSPDGWACISRKQVFVVDLWDDIDSKKVKAA